MPAKITFLFILAVLHFTSCNFYSASSETATIKYASQPDENSVATSGSPVSIAESSFFVSRYSEMLSEEVRLASYAGNTEYESLGDALQATGKVAVYLDSLGVTVEDINILVSLCSEVTTTIDSESLVVSIAGESRLFPRSEAVGEPNWSRRSELTSPLADALKFQALYRIRTHDFPKYSFWSSDMKLYKVSLLSGEYTKNQREFNMICRKYNIPTYFLAAKAKTYTIDIVVVDNPPDHPDAGRADSAFNHMQ